ncbi:ABC transporter permease [Candidatus Methylomirabilis sp.]|uniref:ABC transporter permease n=1 Tax=Candidatus Methylomirabilis sp. TaxID=2032687 RepID=UPI00307685C5
MRTAPSAIGLPSLFGRLSPSYLASALKDFSSHRDLLWNFVVRDFKSRYAGSLIGIFWNVIHPLTLIVIYIVVFSRLMGARLPGASDAYGYSIYLCAGLLPWNAFAEALSRSTTVFLDQAHLLKKVSFPKKLLGGAIILSSLINFLIGYSIFFLFLVLSGHRIGLASLFLPGLLILQFVFAFGLGLFLSTLNVFFRDTAQFTGVGLQFWFWLTPLVYLEEVLPEFARGLLRLNPMYYFVQGYHAVIVHNTSPSWPLIGMASVLSLAALVVGSLVFFQLKDEIVDEV